MTRRAHEVLRALEASAPKNKVEQMDFDALQEYASPAVPSEMMEQLEALDDEWHQQHNRFSEQQKCLFIPVEWLGRIEASLQDVGAQIKQAKQP